MHDKHEWLVKQMSDEALDREYAARVRNDRVSAAELLMYLGEMEARKRYVPAGYSSMFRFCVESGRMSEDVAYKRIRTARMARRFPGIYERIADGRLTISAVVLLAPELTDHTAARLLSMAEHKTNEEVKRLLAGIAPKPDVPTREREVPSPAAPLADLTERSDVSDSSGELAARPVVPSKPVEDVASLGPVSGAAANVPVPDPSTAPHAPAAPRTPRAQHSPLSPTSMHVSMTLSMRVYEQLQEARELLSHRLSSRDLAEVLEAMLQVALPALRKQKFAETSRASGRRRSQEPSAGAPDGGRQVPADVKRRVWERDGGRCTFVGSDGHRCTSRERIEFDHRIPVARGGESTVENVRLLCHVHNQFEAERVLGEGFMRGKRAWASGRAKPRRKPSLGGDHGDGPTAPAMATRVTASP